MENSKARSSRAVKIRAGMHQVKMVALHFLVLADLTVNVMFDSAEASQFKVAAAMIAQILATILMAGCLYSLFCATFVFQAGLLSVLINDFRGALLSLPLNLGFLLWVRIKTLMVLHKGDDVMTIWDDDGFYFAYTMHKIISLMFYYHAITTAFSLGEVKYYKPDAWRIRTTR